jgi:hypothetical protein
VGARKIWGLHGRVLWVAGFVLWGVALATGFHKAMGWEFQPGQAALPAHIHAKPDERPLLIVVLHSQCPCSLATIENLTTLSVDQRHRLRIRFVFTGPDMETSPAAKKASSFAEAEKEFLSEAEVVGRYGARTSGQAFLYDVHGHLVFSGGLTEARGVAGRVSDGMSAIVDTLAGRSCLVSAPVYGCALETPK